MYLTRSGSVGLMSVTQGAWIQVAEGDLCSVGLVCELHDASDAVIVCDCAEDALEFLIA